MSFTRMFCYGDRIKTDICEKKANHRLKAFILTLIIGRYTCCGYVRNYFKYSWVI